MTRADDVLTQIDHAVTDWETSGDAMRWTPEPPADPAPRPQITHEDLEPLREAFRRIGEAYAEAARQISAGMARMLNEIRRTHRERQEPDPKAWTAFTRQPHREPRARHRNGPNPRRLSVHHAPKRAGRRP